jgi:hypothetical protein
VPVADTRRGAGRRLVSPEGWTAQSARVRRGAATATTLVASALLVAACGGGSPNAGVAHLGSTTASTASATGSRAPGAQALKFSACMRSHGVPHFPDPEVSSGAGGESVRIHVTPSSGINPSSPTFKHAQQACRAFAPVEGGRHSGDRRLSAQEQAEVLQLAACIRKHGEPNLPDPTFAGGGAHLPRTVNTDSPKFKSAEQACQSLIPSSLRSHAGG